MCYCRVGDHSLAMLSRGRLRLHCSTHFADFSLRLRSSPPIPKVWGLRFRSLTTARRSLQMRSCPARRADSNGVVSTSLLANRFAPLSTSNLTISKSPRMQATCSGVYPRSPALFTFIPASIAKTGFGPIEEIEQIADFNNLEFQRVEPPADAHGWPPNRAKLRRKRARN
jgi:hypothetical protein